MPQEIVTKMRTNKEQYSEFANWMFGVVHGKGQYSDRAGSITDIFSDVVPSVKRHLPSLYTKLATTIGCGCTIMLYPHQMKPMRTKSQDIGTQTQRGVTASWYSQAEMEDGHKKKWKHLTCSAIVGKIAELLTMVPLMNTTETTGRQP
jgi:hypothetical protein